MSSEAAPAAKLSARQGNKFRVLGAGADIGPEGLLTMVEGRRPRCSVLRSGRGTEE